MNDDLEARLVDIERRVTVLEQRMISAHSAPETPTKRLSVQEFLAAKKPTTDLERTVMIAYFMEHFTGVSPYNINDLRDAFRQAREPLPANLSDTVNKNIQKGLIMEVGERKGGLKSWVLTASGEAYVSTKSASKA
jgi:hypothetical protein